MCLTTASMHAYRLVTSVTAFKLADWHMCEYQGRYDKYNSYFMLFNGNINKSIQHVHIIRSINDHKANAFDDQINKQQQKIELSLCKRFKR